MGFFTKTREKGLKSVTKEKQKKAAAAVAAAVLVTSAATLKTQENKKPTSPTLAYPHVNATNLIQENIIKEEQDKKRQKAETTSTTTTQPSIASSSSSLPWWIGDLSFIVEGKKITSHKVVISSKSKALALLIEQNPSGVIEIPDFSHHIFSQLIKWIYGGRFEVSVEDSEDLRLCATVYDVQDLVEACLAVKRPELDFQPVVMAPIMTELANQEISNQEYLRQQQQQQQQQQYYQQQQQFQMQQQQQHYNQEYNLEIPDNIIDDFITSPTLESHSDFEIPSHNPDQGMSIWSDDPILYNPEPHEVDAYRLMEIY